MKKLTYYSQEEYEALTFAAKVIDNGVTLIVYEAIYQGREFVYWSRERGICKGIVKSLTNNFLSEVRKKEALMLVSFKSPGFYKIYSDSIVDHSWDDVEALKKAISDTLDSFGVPNSDVIAMLEVSRVLFEAAVRLFDKAIERITNTIGSKAIVAVNGRRIVRDYAGMFSELSPHRPYQAVKRLAEIVYSSSKGCDLNTPELRSLCMEVVRKFEEGDYIQSCLEDAAKVFPEFKNTIIKREE